MSYNSLNISLIKRATRGLSFKTNYTFGKAIDYNSAGSSNAGTNQPKAILNPFNLALSRGIAAFSLRHQFNANFAYQLPFGQGQRFGGSASGLVNKIIGGWQWNGIVNAQSGFPFTPQAGANVSGTGDTDIPDVPNHNPAFTGPVITGVDGFKKTGRYFDPGAFLLPLSGTFGNVTRGSLTGPPLTTVDTSLFKKIRINEQWNLQFRAEVFNGSQSREFCGTQCSRIRGQQSQLFGGRNHQHGDHVEADPVCLEAALVNKNVRLQIVVPAS